MKLNNEQSFYGHIYETKISDLKSSKEKFGKKIKKKKLDSYEVSKEYLKTEDVVPEYGIPT